MTDATSLEPAAPTGDTPLVDAVPDQDIPELKALGVAEVFTPGAPTTAIIDFIRGAVTP